MIIEGEVWKNISGYDGLYEVSSFGRVMSHHRKDKILSQGLCSGGYPIVVLSRNGKKRSFRVHTLVANSFIPNPLKKRTVNHKNNNKTDNMVGNIEWNTDQENIAHSFANPERRRNKGRTGALCKNSKPVLCIDENGDSVRYAGATEAGRVLGINQSHISSVCLGKRKRTGGFYWRFA